MTLKRKIWLWLGLIVGLILFVDLSIGYRKLDAELRAETEYDARTIYGFMMATRRIYQEQFIASGLQVTEKTVGFLPAHSFSRIAKDFANWNDNGIIFNNVSDVPRNPSNQADRDELIAMDWFRANPKSTERMEKVIGRQNQAYMLYTAPIWVEPFCLKCHGNPADAPESIRTTYSAAYGYKVGDLRGVVSIRIPMAKFDKRFREIWGGQLVKSVVGYTILLLAVGLLIEKLVVNRLSRLQTGAERIAAGDYSTRLDPVNNDEICRLARSFNRMAEEVQTREQMLTKLSLAIEQSPESVVITDLAGNIEYTNNCFTRNTGYSREEALGKNPRLLKSGKTPMNTYHEMWAKLLAGESWQGEFINRRKDGSEYTEIAQISPVRAADGTTTHYLAVKQDITEKMQAEARINELAYYDAITHLPNRALLMNRLTLSLAVAQRQQHIDALVLFNLDRFKMLNDAHGHAVGDRLLIAVGERITGLLREGDTLARITGDEFAILLQETGDTRDAASRRTLTVTEKIHAAMRQPFHLSVGEDTSLTTSIGVTLCPESQGDSPHDVLRRADTALHRAKEAGGNRTAFFENDMGIAAQQRYAIERELRHAIPDGQLRLYLQPQVNADGSVVGAEALVRWQHPTRGLLPPGVFIGIAEESDLIVDLGAWVLSEVCQLMAREALADNPLRIAVNLSPRQFRQHNFVPWLKDLFAATGANTSHLTLEVTEGLVIDNIDEVVSRMSELAALGIQFSIDDFGTGYSSLAYLKRLPIHELKIDKSFVQDAPTDPNDAALVETIISISRHLNLLVVAEGVETPAQAAYLDGQGKIIRQGYLYGKPGPAEEWIARWRQGAA
jgi:diguanylate cyclase (GGDEF)-like protein/PAS domain S-box-containing protein